jgi:hypothetical protein
MKTTNNLCNASEHNWKFHVASLLPFRIPFYETTILNHLVFSREIYFSSCDVCNKIVDKYSDKLSILIKKNNLSIFLYNKYFQNSFEQLPTSLTSIITNQAIPQIILNKVHRKMNRLILSRLTKEKVRYLFLKTYAYSFTKADNENKYVNDLDLLVPTNEYIKCRSILINAGYNSINNTSKSLFFRVPTQESYRKDTHVVEIHTSITDDVDVSRFYLPQIKALELCNKFFSNTITIQDRTLTYKTLSPTNMVLSHFLHISFQHNYQQIVRYVDISQFLEQYGSKIQWEQIDKIVSLYNLQYLWDWYVCILITFYPLLIPKKIRDEMKKRKNSWSIVKKLYFTFTKQAIYYPTIYSLNESSEAYKLLSFNIISRSVKSWLSKYVTNQTIR